VRIRKNIRKISPPDVSTWGDRNHSIPRAWETDSFVFYLAGFANSHSSWFHHSWFHLYVCDKPAGIGGRLVEPKFETWMDFHAKCRLVAKGGASMRQIDHNICMWMIKQYLHEALKSAE
jgi:hypothetical protein